MLQLLSLTILVSLQLSHSTAIAATCQTQLGNQLKLLGVPGLSIGIIKDGKLVCTAAAGMANIKQNIPVKTDTVFTWNSVSKAVTATALMILFDEGRFTLDDDINQYLPYSVRIPRCSKKPVTFRHLLTHSSSIIDNEKVYDSTYTNGDSPVVLGDFLKNYLSPRGQHYSRRKNFDQRCPGRKYRYSNIGAGLIGNLVEHISGQPFDQFCQSRIFGPLGMTQTSFRLADLKQTNIAMPYYGHSKTSFKAGGHIGIATYPDATLRTSVPNLARFLAMMDSGGKYRGQRILKKSTVKEMSRIQNSKVAKTQALIWYYDFNGKLGHDGSGDGAASMMFFDPIKHTGVLMVSNGDFFDDSGGNNLEKNANALLNKLFREADSY